MRPHRSSARFHRIALPALLGMALALAGAGPLEAQEAAQEAAPPAEATAETSPGAPWGHHVADEHHYVRITDGALHPEVLHLESETAVGWMNYSSLIARVSFDKEVAKKLTCRAASGFSITGERLTSPGIQSMQFASLCDFAPGEYTYQVELFPGIGSGSRGFKTFEGRIVVE